VGRVNPRRVTPTALNFEVLPPRADDVDPFVRIFGTRVHNLGGVDLAAESRTTPYLAARFVQ
jgi:hypothetical protein